MLSDRRKPGFHSVPSPKFAKTVKHALTGFRKLKNTWTNEAIDPRRLQTTHAQSPRSHPAPNGRGIDVSGTRARGLLFASPFPSHFLGADRGIAQRACAPAPIGASCDPAQAQPQGSN